MANTSHLAAPINLSKRPFFLLVAVDAPLTLRYKWYQRQRGHTEQQLDTAGRNNDLQLVATVWQAVRLRGSGAEDALLRAPDPGYRLRVEDLPA